MTDAIQVLKPGTRITDGAGTPVNGAILQFFAAGTSTPLEVFSDADLSESLGVEVTCNSVGLPTSDGNAVVEIYTGTDPFKLEITDSDGVLIPGMSWDNIKGADDLSAFLTDVTIGPSTPVTNTSSNQTPTLADKGKFYNVDCSGGDKSVTNDAAATIGDSWSIKVRHDGSANQVLVTGNGTDLFKISGRAGVTGFALVRRGQTVVITCDGTGFHVEESSPGLFNTTGVILIADVLSAPPGGPEAGARYILGAAPSGAWSTFAQHDIAEYSGSGWFKITPPGSCGWLAYVQSDNTFRAYKSSSWLGMSRVKMQLFTGSGTYTPTPGLSYGLIIASGGGGGGGGAASTDASADVASGGGGAGGTAIRILTSAQIGSSQTVTIGAAGAAGTSAGGDGGAGGDTTFGSFITATGGAGGTGLANAGNNVDSIGGSGGSPTGGDFNLQGGDGHGGVCGATTKYGGSGGGSFWGGGPQGARNLTSGTGVAGRVGTSAGTGGSGACSINQNSATGVAGGAGAAGVVMVLEFF